MAKHVDAAVRQAVLEDIKNGMKVSEASVKHGVTSNAIYLWLKAQADNTGTSSLEVAKLRKENQELKEIIGLFALDKKRAEKNAKGS
jgi:transposase-like protein